MASVYEFRASPLAESWISDDKLESAYDTLQWYIEHCYPQADPIRTLANALPSASTHVYGSRYRSLEQRKWILDTVLKLRSDEEWFCWAVLDLARTYGGDQRSGLAILKFLLENSRCPNEHDIFAHYYSESRKTQISFWQDTAKNPDLVYFDSSLPSLHELGLDSLLQYAAGSGVRYVEPGSQIISRVDLASNPVGEIARLTVTTEREAFIYAELYDVLGRKLEEHSQSYRQGTHEITFDLSKYASGNYYLRVRTANNELKTLRLTKE